MKKKKKIKLYEIIRQHIMNNKKEYFIVSLIFLLGLFLGVVVVNNTQEVQTIKIETFLHIFIEKLKTIDKINYTELIKDSIIQNIFWSVILWFFGTTVIGIPVVFGLVLYRGFCLGYTISNCILILGIPKGICFVLILLLLQNIVFIPSILALAVSGIKLYKSIIKDRNKENIKIEVIRHTAFSTIMMISLIFSSLVEVFISTNVLKFFIIYF